MKHTRIRMVIAAALCIALVGCGDVPDISEAQSDLIAEYAGGVLLRYSHRYDLRLVLNDADDDGVEDALGQAASGEAVSEQVLAEETISPTATPKVDDTSEPDESSEPEVTEPPTVSLDELYNIKGLEFSYNSSEFTDRYPKNSDVVEITPDDGEILYVVKFNVKNTSSKSVKVNLTKRSFHYELSIAGDTVLPTLSLLPNGGLNYLMTTIKAGETEEAVLIFNLDQSRRDAKDNTLSITEGDKTAIINL